MVRTGKKAIINDLRWKNICVLKGGSHVTFCPPSPVKGKKGQDKKGQKGTKGDKKGQNGHKNTKNGKNGKK